MFRVSTKASFGLRCGVVVFVSAFAFASLTSSADARSKRKFFSKRAAASQSYSPRYADIVVDANTGDVLHSTNPDAQRHPASLTKIMTLYLLFEQLEAGRIRLDSQMEVSAHASVQSPTKLGLRRGQTLMVEDAIKALVTKSANDAAVVIAEALAGSEDQFAILMTRKARALRMTRTVYKNASGLPDSDQVTTARDQALLGLAIQDRFPRYYRYFATESFAYRGVRMSNHNRLLGRVEGVNGIKTGYTNASGFNLVSAVQRGDRRLVAVVLGGTSGGARDAKMRSLIEQKITLASTRRTAPKIVEVADASAPFPTPVSPPAPAAHPFPIPPAAPAAQVERPVRVASTSATLPTRPETPRNGAVSQSEQPSPGSTEPIKPLLVKTLSVKAGPVRTASAPMSLLAPEPMATRTPNGDAQTQTMSDAMPPAPLGARPGVLGVLSSRDIASRDATPRTVTASVSSMPASAPRVEATASQNAKAETVATSETKKRSGWMIQIGAFEDASEAKEKLADAKNKTNLLKDAEPFTEIFAKGDKRYYRARFAGLRENAAEQACRQLKKNQIACFAVKN
jgi:D-alanyl-D-alanine carboxypeptidase